MDNRIFNVNGDLKNSEMLLATLELVFCQFMSDRKSLCKAWAFDSDKGLILLWHHNINNKKENRFPSILTAKQCLPFIQAWLESEQAGTVNISDWDSNYEHDGSNSKGWRIYCENWGHVGEYNYSICAIKPAFMWHGK